MDRRIHNLIESSVVLRHRSMLFICGPSAKDQVGHLHHVLAKCHNEAKLKAPSILWCFKKDIPLAEHHRKKRLKKLRNANNDATLCDDDVMEHFLISSTPHFCHFSETDRVLGQTFSMAVVQDFEAVTPNSLARITECVGGGGLIIILLPIPITQLGDMQMDAHAKFVTESHPHVSPLFNRRLVLSLNICTGLLVLDDHLQIKMEPQSQKSLLDIDVSSPLVFPDTLTEAERSIYLLCLTPSQISALQSLQTTLESSDAHVVALSSGRGRGKSAILGLAVALGISRGGPMHVIVTSPHTENVKSFFDFICRGLETVGLKDYILIKDASGLTTSIRVSHMSKKARVEYRTPVEHQFGSSADLVVIDEAAAIPLPLVKGWIHQGLTTWMASTIHGYEGTGRSLSLKLLNDLGNPFKSTDHILVKVELTEPIRYAKDDPIEEWLNQLLCLEVPENQLLDRAPPSPSNCQLYGVNRTCLFSGSHGSEVFLQNLVSLFVASHYRNSPNDLLMMADAPAHRLYCLIEKGGPPTPLCAIQVALEGGLSRKSSHSGSKSSEQELQKRSPGDLIPWTISQQFQDKNFITLLSARIVRIATHPAYQGMGYGRRALELLSEFYSSKKNADCQIENKNKKELLLNLQHEEGEGPLDYLGVSYGLTSQLFKFWKNSGFVPVYIRQSISEVTGENTCIMIKSLRSTSWMQDFSLDFFSRFCSLLPSAFKHLPSPLVIQVLQSISTQTEALHEAVLKFNCNPRSMLRLESYCKGEMDYHLVADLLPHLAPLMLMGRLQSRSPLLYNQECTLVGIGLQYKSSQTVSEELGLDPSVVMTAFRKAVKKIFVALQSS